MLPCGADAQLGKSLARKSGEGAEQGHSIGERQGQGREGSVSVFQTEIAEALSQRLLERWRSRRQSLSQPPRSTQHIGNDCVADQGLPWIHRLSFLLRIRIIRSVLRVIFWLCVHILHLDVVCTKDVFAAPDTRLLVFSVSIML